MTIEQKINFQAVAFGCGMLGVAIIWLLMRHQLFMVLNDAPYGFAALWLLAATLYREIAERITHTGWHRGQQ